MAGLYGSITWRSLNGDDASARHSGRRIRGGCRSGPQPQQQDEDGAEEEEECAGGRNRSFFFVVVVVVVVVVDCVGRAN